MANVALLQKDDDCITCALSCGADFPFILPGAASGAPNEVRYSSLFGTRCGSRCSSPLGSSIASELTPHYENRL